MKKSPWAGGSKPVEIDDVVNVVVRQFFKMLKKECEKLPEGKGQRLIAKACVMDMITFNAMRGLADDDFKSAMDSLTLHTRNVAGALLDLLGPDGDAGVEVTVRMLTPEEARRSASQTRGPLQ